MWPLGIRFQIASKMFQITWIHFVGITVAIVLISNCVVCHEKSTNNYRKRRFTDDDVVQLQQKSSIEPFVTDQRHLNMFKDRFNNDKIVFDRHPTTTERVPTASMSISNNTPQKSNETNHQYSGTANGEYEFR